MAVDPWMIDASGGAPAYTAQEARLLLVTPFVVGAGASLGVRSGVRLSGSGTDLLVQAQGSPNMSVLVNPGVCVVQGAISATQGAYTWALDTVTTLTVAAAHATLTRTDLVVVRIRDAGVDTSGGRDASVQVITGTAGSGVPSLPADATYMTIAQINVRSVSAGGGTIVAGDITDKRPFTVAPGGTLPCTSTTRPSSPITGITRIYEMDTGHTRVWNGAKWMREPVRVSTPSPTTYTSTTTFSNVPGLSVPVDANSKYAVEFHLMVFGIQNVGLKVGVSMPTGAILDGLVAGFESSAGGFVNLAVNGSNTSPVNLISYGFNNTAPANRSPVTFRGTLTVGGTAGTIAIMGAQGTSSATSSAVDPPSWLEIRQIA